MKTNKLAAIAMSIVLLAVIACEKEKTQTTTPTPTVVTDSIPSSYIKITETYVLGAAAKAVIYSDKQLFVGYNNVYVAMYDSATNTRLSDGHFDLETMMDMGMMTHGSPVEVEDISEPADKFWKAKAIFTMPSSAGKWYLHIHFHNHKNDKEGEAEVEVNVAQPSNPVLKTIVAAADDSSKLIISLVKPLSPKTGINDIEFTIHKMASMSSFPSVEDYTIDIEPTMPSMGHGSTGNVNPTHTSMGHYVGKVNFSMVGLWQIKVTLKKNGKLIDNSLYFNITL